jgi:cell division protein FtsA
MKIYSPTLFIEIDNSEYIFTVGEAREENFKLIYECITPIQGIENFRITNFDLVLNDIKKNIYLAEQKLNFTFKDTVLIINNFNRSFINLTGFKKLNGSQISKENITYILNSLKSTIDEFEDEKILHIFNSQFFLDKKKIENLPIGLFGDFYSHELSFNLINNNDYKNLNNIFKKCNLKIKKILFKGFIEGCHIIENKSCDSFFQIKINKKNSQLLYFENESLKFEQNFNFGSDIVANDISQVTSLKIDMLDRILNNINFNQNESKDELIEKDLFQNENYIKIKKKLLFDVAEARIEEFLEIIIIKNINLFSFNKKQKEIFIKIKDKSHLKFFENIYKTFLLEKNYLKVKFVENITNEDLINNANQLVLYGWKKEAIPVNRVKKSLIARFFHALFD